MKKVITNKIALFCLIIPPLISLGLLILSKSSFSIMRYSPWLFLAQCFGVLAITFISLNFIFTTRLRVLERFFDGLDNVYKFHKITGILGLACAVLHFTSLLIHGSFYPTLLRVYLIPSDYWSLNFARISLVIFIILGAMTAIKSIPYNIWKVTHQYLGVAFFFAVLHVLTVKSDVNKNLMLKYWIALLMSIGLLAFIYTKLLYRFLGPKHYYVVSQMEKLKGNVNLIYMKPLKKHLNYRPGQYVFVSFLSEKIGKESHPFSLVSVEEEKILKISPKELGDYTRKLRNLEIGTAVEVWGPYGTFGDPFLIDEKEQVWIAGGIGITPFLSMLEHEKFHKMKAKKTIIYCSRSLEWSTYDTHLIEETAKLNLSLIIHFSNDEGYLTFDRIKAHVPDIHNKLFMICGPTKMRKGVEKMLADAGVDKTNILYEDFFI